MTQTPGEKIAALTSDMNNVKDDVRDIQREIRTLSGKVESHGALFRWVMGVAAGAGAVGTLLIKRIGEVLGL